MRNLHMGEAGNDSSWKEQKKLFVNQGKIKKEKGKGKKLGQWLYFIYIYIYIY
jgi:hypothetical protein